MKERICVIPRKEVQEDTRLVSGDRAQNSSCLWELEVLAGTGPKGSHSSNEDVLCLHLVDRPPHLSQLFKPCREELHLCLM